ncbi:uncharacterized protein LOC110460833 [Mizuhopecten yessoensis]|uniref:Uncharacterized protein n=1 Tax=Mizuhopecten yessoensis TaxID=6573 RepID=A0A210Q1L6_MIZYE|nr:uncharacterized protein LOC110460833 [Mizuhopecten yessoensis]XP_021369684.1 uncharacterized protein LOC110460833 [Mizuhopecten yessoensis]OWF42612.1 hypothetical protein KP79_PYT10214 [Mizuhopecten yessoensis]
MSQSIQKWCVLCILMLILVLAVVGFGTPSWYRLRVASVSPYEYTAGFFQACTSSQCTDYLSYTGLNTYDRSFIGSMIFNILGIMLLLASVVTCVFTLWDPTDVCGCVACFTDKRKFLHVTWLALLAGLCLLVSVIWFAVSVIKDMRGLGQLAVGGAIIADYSLALVAIASALAILFALIMSILLVRNFFIGTREVVMKRRIEEVEYTDDRLTIHSEYSKREPLALPEPVYTVARPEPMRMIQAPPQVVEVPVPQPVMVPQPVVMPPQVRYVEVPKPVIQRQIVKQYVDRPVPFPVPQPRPIVIQQQAPMMVARQPVPIRLPALPAPPVMVSDPIYMQSPRPYIVTEPEPIRMSRSFQRSKRYMGGAYMAGQPMGGAFMTPGPPMAMPFGYGTDSFGDGGEMIYDSPTDTRPYIP